MKMEPLMIYRAMIKGPVQVGAGPFGTRVIYDVTGGEFSGPRLHGRILPGGGDWLLFDSEGVGRLDVRATFETHDGAMIYLHYNGIMVVDEVMARALAAGEETQFGDAYFVTQPRFETGDSRYHWLNRIATVAEGRLIPEGVEYRVFEIAPG